MILVYSPQLTKRLRYTASLLFRDLLKDEASLTDEPDRFRNFDGPKVCYSEESLGEGLHIQPAGLLEQRRIREGEPDHFEWEGMDCLYRTGLESFPFDPFSAAFWMVTRYEEYQPHTSDEFGRFRAPLSMAYRKGFLRKPVVDHWALYLRSRLQDLFPGYRFPNREYRYLSTVDIDNAFAYREKGVVRTVGGLLRSLFNRRTDEMVERVRAVSGKTPDPYDSYDRFLALRRAYQVEMVFFFLLGDYGLNDKNVPYTSERLRSLIQYLGDYAKVGIHPSYNSNLKPQKLPIEIRRLANIVKRDITRSRQHFLILRFPETYQMLLNAGITEDHTMGFASENGFRAGTCTPYLYYDIDLELPTKLRVYPFTVMDATLLYYLELTPEEAIERIRDLVQTVRAVKGTFISLWHNESLSERAPWTGWTGVYEEMLKMAGDDQRLTW